MKKTTKIGIIGAGNVGSHVASSLITQGLCNSLVLLDIDVQKALGHAQDLADSIPYMPLPTRVFAGGYEDLADADIVVLAACGTALDADRLKELDANMAIVQEIAGRLAGCGFGGIVLSITNPCDVVAQVFAQRSGLRVIGTGTALDSARLRRRLAALLGVAPQSVIAYMLGEHGDSQMAALSAATVAGLPLNAWLAQHPQQCPLPQLVELQRETRESGWQIVLGKGCTEFGIAAAAARIIRAILQDEKALLPCSTLLTGQYGQAGMYASTLCQIGAGGVEDVLQLPLSPSEQAALAQSCQTIAQHVARY